MLWLRRGDFIQRTKRAFGSVLILLLSAGANLGLAGTAFAAPSAPTNVSATGISTTQIQVSWTDSLTNETKFDIEYSYDKGTWSYAGVKGGDATTGTDTVLHSPMPGGIAGPNRYSWYRVRACDGTGCSAWTTTPSLAYTWVNKANAPRTQKVTSLSAEVALTLPDGNPQTGGIGISDTYYLIKDENTGTVLTEGSLWDGAFTWHKINLQPGTTYNLVAVARNGESVEAAPSAPTTVTTIATVPPANFSVVGTTENTITVRWQPGGGDETSYEAYLRRPDRSGYDLDGTVPVDGRTDYEYTYTNADGTGPTVVPNVDYAVYVVAVGSSRQPSSTQYPVTAPAAISLSYANLTSTGVDLSIDYNSNSDFTLYEISVATQFNSYWLGGAEIGSSLPRWQTAAQWPNPHSVGLQGGTDYTFTPYLKSVTGQIIAGTILNLKASPVNPTPPTGSIIINQGNPAYATTSSVILYLTYRDDDDGVDLVRYSNDGTFDAEPWEVPGPSKAWTLSPGDGTKTVYYQIRDKAGALSVPYSDTIILDTLPPTGSVSYSTTAPTNQNVAATLAADETVTVTNNGGSFDYTFTDNGEFTFQFIDQAGWTGAATATVSSIDRLAPTITLAGPNPQTIVIGNQYTELGASALDQPGNVDLTSQIRVVSSAVNTSVIGDYSVTYDVTDVAGNAALRVIRTVRVVAATTYEDGTDGNTAPWFIAPAGAGGVIQNVADDGEHGSVIELSGASPTTRIVYYAPAANPWALPGSHPVMQWDMKYNGKANILIMLKTDNVGLNNGYQYLSYATDNTPGLMGNKVYYRLDASMADGNWHTITRNLPADLAAYLPGTTIEKIWYFSIYGNGRVDNLKQVASLPMATASGLVTDGQNNPLSGVAVSADPAGISAVTDGSGRYTLSGLIPGNHTVKFQRSGYTFPSMAINVDGAGTDLAPETAVGNVIPSIRYEDGSDGDTSPWFINPAGASGVIQNVIDDDAGHGAVIELSGAPGSATRLVYYAPSNNPWALPGSHPVMQWDMKYNGKANILIMLKTDNVGLNNGYQYLSYATDNTPGLRDNKVYYRLDASMADGNWHTITRNLPADLAAYLPGTTIERIWYFSIYGNGRVDNLMMLNQ